MSKRNKDGLTDQQILFCHEYLKDLNATQAAIRAGYSEKTARQIASENLSKPDISDRIAQLKSEQLKRVVVDADQVLSELNRLGYSDLRSIYDENGAVLHPTQWPDELARAVSSIEVKEEFEDGEAYCEQCHKAMHRTLVGFTKKVKLWDKPKSLEMLGRHKKLFTDKLEITDKTGIAQRLAKARKRKAE